MVSKPKRSIAERLLDAQVTIDITLADAEAMAALAEYGYDEARLREGRALYEEARRLANRKAVAYGKQAGATARVRDAWAEARAAYGCAFKIARIAFRERPTVYVGLMMQGRRKQDLAGWLEQAEVFYSNLLGDADLLAVMEGYGYDRAKLEAEQALVQQIRRADAAQDAEKGKARKATARRDAKLRELDRWVADLKVITRIALGKE